MAEKAVCGTPAGYQAHRKRGDRACDACRRANADYRAELRRRNPEDYADELKANAAVKRALHRLRREYPASFQELYLEEIRKPSKARS